MRRSVAVRLSPILIAATCLPASAAESVPPQEPAAVYPTSTSVVTLDFVVRDKKGRPVKNVRPEEVEVFEDSQRCEVKSFRLVDAAMAQPSGAPVSPIQRTTSSAAEPGELLNLISLVFDRLDADGGRLAQKGARDFVASLTPRDRVAVFRIGAGLQLVVPFTNDQRVLAEAIDAASRPGTEPHSLLREALQAWNNYLRMAHPDLAGPNVQMPGAAEERADAIPAGTCGAACAKELEVTANILRWADQQQRQDEATRSLYGFLALVKAQEEVAGRKTVILFSPGFSVLPAVEEALRAAIGQANRANVSFYAVDTRGLRQKSDNADTASMLQSAVTASRSQGDAEVKREQVYALDSAAESIRLGPQGNLRDLAESTGGFLTANTNDLTAGLGRIRDDIGSYYQVTYTSPRPEADGSFRRIAIKTSRRDATVQGRSGYQALAARVPTPSASETAPPKSPDATANADMPVLPGPPEITAPGTPPGLPSPTRTADSALAALLEKAGMYVAGYEVAFSDLVVEEKYTQRLLSPLGGVKQTRVMRSDLLFVRLPGDFPWTTFRDVFESDGRAVRDRESRLQKLFVDPAGKGAQHAEAILRESARFNLGRTWRNFNVPVTALLFLHPRNQARFAFEQRGKRTIAGVPTVQVRYQEVRRPALILDRASGGGIAAHGDFWIDPLTGRVLRSEMTLALSPAAEVSLLVDFRPVPSLDLWAPSEMREFWGETYLGAEARDTGHNLGPSEQIECVARYSNYRRFVVDTTEDARVKEDPQEPESPH